MVKRKTDLAILKFALEQKFVTLMQVTRMFFPETEKIFNWPMKCVRRLVLEGYLKAERPGFCDAKLYYVSPKGEKLLRSNGCSGGLGAVKRIDARNLEHDLLVTEIRIIFEKLLCLMGWKSERLLRKELQKQKVPDGMVCGPDGINFVIEVERTLKRKEYYEKNFRKMCITEFPSENELILYIMANETEKKRLMKLAKSWDRIFFTTTREVLEMKYTLTFENSQSESFKLNRYGEGGVHFNEAPLDQHEDPFWREVYRGEKERREFEQESTQNHGGVMEDEQSNQTK